jgi:hypothetical protein
LDCVLAADWSALLLPVVVLVALGVAGAAAAPLWAFWSVALLELLELAEGEADVAPGAVAAF